jgi:hypothetical protein
MSEPINDLISLNIVNNTNLPQKANILGGTQDPLGVPPHSIYQWDLSTEDYKGVTTVQIKIGTVPHPSTILYTVTLVNKNIQGVVVALNTLNKGIFQYYGTTLYVSNDYYIYDKITLA